MTIANQDGHIDRQSVLPFFQDEPPPKQTRQRHRIQQTSLEAYRAADVTGLRLRVLAFFRQRGATGATLDEISAGLGVLIQSVCPANLALRKLGLVEETDERRETRNGRKAIVWRVVE